MAVYFKLPHPGGPTYDPAVNPANAAKTWNPPPAYPQYPTNYQPHPVVVAAVHKANSIQEEYEKSTSWRDDPGQEMRDVVPELFSFRTDCPAAAECGDYSHPASLYNLVQHLNDSHNWERERIADWLDTLPVDLTFKAKGGDHAEDEQNSVAQSG